MAGQLQEEQQVTRPKVMKVDSVETWDSYVSQATNQGCPIITHFTASWCMPSVAMNSFFEEIASDYPDVLFLTVDVDEVKEVATRLEIKAMPTFSLIRDGATVDKLVGANPEEIRKRIEGFLQSKRVDVA
ncbi:thioredoxin-like protein CXXS1 [Pyrus ussuriensis x Pyrus communis]|uniref:Thioredoxin-like protein CXXS1 n=1 Tax=Pyrus ussuriensis x Pyrus communis TaxID=2448454 RepID=A0A5N5FD74_9ROSA|nr:thioredoxin-like protein CXXS1 [Pyrus x bretschneideri]KAB2601066.1 thioredoxin-like protein CXXS1 [Pyrus ussuriensis x Pyrus communis]